MTPSDLEQRLRAAVADASFNADPPSALIGAVQRRRARRAAVTIVSTAAAVAAAVAVPAVLASSSSPAAQRRGPAVKPPLRHASPSPAATIGQFAPLPTDVPADQGEPSMFFAAAGAGAERLAIVDSSSGRVERYLQQHGSQALLTFSANRTVAWQWNERGCGNVWSQIDLATGVASPAFTDLPNPNEVAVSAGSRRIAYVYTGPQKQVPVTTRTGTKMMPAGCPSASQTLVVTDTDTGLTREWPLPDNAGEAWYLALDSTATKLAFVEGGRVRVLDINRDTTIAQAQPLTQADPQCQQSKPQSEPGSDGFFVQEMCAASSAIIGVRVGDGTVTYRHDIHGRGLIAAYSLDRSGHHLIYSFDPSDNTVNGVVYVAGAGDSADRRVMSDVFDLSW